MAKGSDVVGTRQRMTLRDVAEHLGVSVATVSRVLNGRPDVAPATREAVVQFIRDTGFSANQSARRLAGSRAGLVGLSLPYIHSPYFAEIAAGGADALAERDARLVLCLTEHKHDLEVTLLDRLMHSATDGAILVLPSETNAELLGLQGQGFPFVVVDPRVPLDESIPVVTASHFHIGHVAADHLLELGHRRIGLVTGFDGWVATIDRLAGFRAAMAAADLLVVPELVRMGDWEVDSAVRAASALLDLPEPPTAIFAFNDNMAVGVVQAARRRGLEIPEDLSVVGVDDTGAASLLTPALTTVRQPLREMARVATMMLWRLIEGEIIETSRLELSTRLIIRESTAPPRR